LVSGPPDVIARDVVRVATRPAFRGTVPKT
jgi:hypothetical protein